MVLQIISYNKNRTRSMLWRPRLRPFDLLSPHLPRVVPTSLCPSLPVSVRLWRFVLARALENNNREKHKGISAVLLQRLVKL